MASAQPGRGHEAAPSVRILVDSGDYACSNLGDVAMLQVALQRLREVFPESRLNVLTDDPDALSVHCPGARPVSSRGRCEWFVDAWGFGRLKRLVPQISYAVDRATDQLRWHWPAVWEQLVRLRLRLKGRDRGNVRGFLDVFSRADLCVVAGAGGITDHASVWSHQMLNLLEMASRRGVPTAIFGHGLGPLTDERLRKRTSSVLRSVKIIALRERRAGPAVLRSLNVDGPEIHVTGDDAIEMAYAARSEEPGNALGVNLRVARSAGVGAELIEPVRKVIESFSGVHGARLVPVPIGLGRASQDAATIRELLVGSPADSEAISSLDTPVRVIRQVGQCRVVMTGAYHAAVFALSQGIPAVCLARSAYFIDKFLGLADQFERGCEVVLLDGRDMPARLTAALESAWLEADSARPGLLEAARRQIAASRLAYERLVGFVSPALHPEPEQHGRDSRVSAAV